MEQVQLIVEKEMTSKLLKKFTARTCVYSFLYFSTIVLLFFLSFSIKATIWFVILVETINVLFLMLLSKLSTIEAFVGINTTSAPKQSLQRIANAAAIPMFIFTCLITFIDIIFLHSVLDISFGYTREIVMIFTLIIFINMLIWLLTSSVYEKRILKKYLTLED